MHRESCQALAFTLTLGPFVCMNAHTMSPEEAADAVKAFHPKVAIPYDYQGSDPQIFAKALEGTGIDVRLLKPRAVDCVWLAPENVQRLRVGGDSSLDAMMQRLEEST